MRLRVRVRGDQLSVIDSHLVDGPLAQTTAFPGSNAYEVTFGERLLYAGALPDLGVQRSFDNPAGPTLQRGHHLTERDGFEFSARVPAHEQTADTLGGIRIILHRVKEEARTPRLGSQPLGQQVERELLFPRQRRRTPPGRVAHRDRCTGRADPDHLTPSAVHLPWMDAA
ncbi:MAG: hypothetical protein ACR2G2_14985 [Pseudonocardia sp.]